MTEENGLGVFGPTLRWFVKIVKSSKTAPHVPVTLPKAANEIRVYRFGDRRNPGELLPNLEKYGSAADRKTHAHLMRTDPNYLVRRAEDHSEGDTENSPFVSVALNPNRAAEATDQWLRPITRQAPDLCVIDVRYSQLFGLANKHGRKETEMLYHGNDLIDHVVRWMPNPFRGTP